MLFFREAKTLLADLGRMDVKERNNASFYSVDGEVLELRPRGRGLCLVATGVVDDASLRSALAAVADDPAADTDPAVVSKQLERSSKSRGRQRNER